MTLTDYLNAFCLGAFPYIAVTVAIVGSLYRLRHAPLTWRTGSSQILRSGSLRWGSILFHFAMLNLLAGHIFGMLTPHWLYESVGLTTPLKQRLEIAMGFIMVPIALAGLGLLLWRRLVDPRLRAQSSWGDVLLLGTLAVQLVLGFFTITQSLHHLDGSVMLRITGWAQHAMLFRVDAWRELLDVPLIYRVHIVVGFAFIFALPFSRLVHVLSGLIIGRYVLRPWQVVRAGHWSHD